MEDHVGKMEDDVGKMTDFVGEIEESSILALDHGAALCRSGTIWGRSGIYKKSRCGTIWGRSGDDLGDPAGDPASDPSSDPASDLGRSGDDLGTIWTIRSAITWQSMYQMTDAKSIGKAGWLAGWLTG